MPHSPRPRMYCSCAHTCQKRSKVPIELPYSTFKNHDRKTKELAGIPVNRRPRRNANPGTTDGMHDHVGLHRVVQEEDIVMPGREQDDGRTATAGPLRLSVPDNDDLPVEPPDIDTGLTAPGAFNQDGGSDRNMDGPGPDSENRLNSPPREDGDTSDKEPEEEHNPNDNDEELGAGGIGMNTRPLGDEEIEMTLDIADDDDIFHEDNIRSPIPAVKIAYKYIQHLKNASLDEDMISPAVRERLRHPLTSELKLDPSTAFALEIFLATTNGSQQMYDDIRGSYHKFHPDQTLPSQGELKTLLTDVSGLEPILCDMCPNSCVAYAGPLATLNKCPERSCGLPRYKSNGRPQQQFQTFPIGPMIQALFRSKESARQLQYRQNHTQKSLRILREKAANGQLSQLDFYDDIFSGSTYLSAVVKKEITDNAITLMLSLDGAQLYRHKKDSSFWIYIWVVLDYSPDLRYKKKKVLIGGIIPASSSPKDVASFLFPGLHHLAAVQKEGLRVWDASKERIDTRQLHDLSHCADGPGMIYVNGATGHKGYKNCRMICPMKSRRKPNTSTYYPACQCPSGNFVLPGSDHRDIDLRTLPELTEAKYREHVQRILDAPTVAEYNRVRMETGIATPSILSGLSRCPPITRACAMDIMHLFSLNLTDLVLSCWRGTIRCDPTDDIETWSFAVLRDDKVWRAYGDLVEAATPYIPDMFGRVPGNIAEKINSGFKACQHSLHLYGLAPGLIKHLLPARFHSHICQLVRFVFIMEKRRKPGISREEITLAYNLGINFIKKWEDLYVERKVERLHFCPPCLHTMYHCPLETLAGGPLACVTQWTTERTIGNIGEEVKQPSNPMANIAARSLRRNQVNIVLSMALTPSMQDDSLPKGAVPVGAGYAILYAHEESPHVIDCPHAKAALRLFFERFSQLDGDWRPKLAKWGRLQLPNGQIARSLWGESRLQKPRRARCVKLKYNDEFRCAEVQFYFITKNAEGNRIGAALVSLYTQPFQDEYKASHEVLYICRYQKELGYVAVEVTDIDSVIAMVPMPHYPDGTFFRVEKVGLDVEFMGRVE